MVPRTIDPPRRPVPTEAQFLGFALDDAVVYRSHPNAPAEDGIVVGWSDEGLFVRYRGDTTAKLTRASDLERRGPQ